jgi:hypothetical protein
MVFPDTILPIKVEMAPAGTWIDITDYVYKESVQITRGSADESSRTQPSACTFLLNNADGRFSPRNPTGPYYGLIGRNTPLLVSIEEGDRYLDVPGSGDARVNDTAQLDITGDIDVRVDATLYNWAIDPDGGSVTELAAKMGNLGAGQTSWAFGVDDDGGLIFEWSEDGTDPSANFIVLSTVSISPYPHGRLAVRATLDVDDGAGGHAVTFYTAPDIDGPWEQLGEPVSDFVGTTSIFNSTSPVRVGDSWGNIAFTAPRGKIWAFQLYNGINGDLAAGADFRVQTDGDTSFTGDAGETWSVTGSASINNQINRFRGEVVAWPSRWETGGHDVWVSMRAESLLRRHNQGQGDLRSTLARRIPSDAATVAYWPMEDGEAATRFGSLTSGVQPMTFSGDVTPAAHAGPDGSDSLPSFAAGAKWSASIPGANAVSTGQTFEWIVNLQQVTATERTIMYVQATGTVITWRFLVDNSSARIIGYNRSGTEVVNQGVALDINGEMLNKWVRWKFRIEQDGANVDWTASWIPIGGAGGSFSDTYAGTCGRFSALSGPDGISADIDGISWGHVAVFNGALANTDDPFNDADQGFVGENADRRFERLIEEEGESGIFYGARDQVADMGAQRPTRYVNLLEEVGTAEYGIFTDSRDDADSSSFVLITRSALYNQAPRLVLDYEGDGQVHAPLDPTDDDLYVQNAVTATRERGASVYLERSTAAEGPLSVEEIGKYDTELTVNIEDDDRLIDYGGWALHLGTWDEERYPTVLVKLHAAPSLIADASQVNVGSKIVIRNSRDETIREWIPPGDIELHVRGYRERFSQFQWEIEFQCVPARPWDVAVLDALSSRVNRIDTDGTELAEALDTTETGVTVFTTDGPTWTDTAEDYPFEVSVGGEVIRVVAPGAVTPNPLFEDGTTSWSAGGTGTIAESTAFVHPDPQANQSLLLTPDGVSAVVNAVTTSGMSVNPGGTYVTSAWVYSPGGWSDVRAVLEWYDSGASLISQPTGSASVIPAGEWTYIEQEFAAPSTAATARMRVRVAGTPAASDVLYIWRAQVNRRYASWAYDEFGRTLTDSWGSTDSQDTWTNAGGVAGNFDVGSGRGSHALTTTNASRRSTFPGPADTTDFDITCDIACSAVATGATIFGGIVARVVDADNLYYLRLNFLTTGAVQLELRERTAAVEATLGTAFTLAATYAADTYFRVRFQGSGSTLRGKAWLASGGAEPDVWQVSATDSTATGTTMGLRSISSAGTTNVNPEIRFQNFQLLNPQALNVQRSVNGVVKAHSLGDPLSLTYPMHLAL